MGIRIVTSLLYALQLETKETGKSRDRILKEFVRDYTSVNIKFLSEMVKNRKKTE